MTDKTPTYDDWKAKADKEVKGRDLTWHTLEGFDVKPLYTSADAEGLDPGVPEGLQAPELDGQGTVVQLADFPKYGQGPLRFLPAVEADDVGIDLAQAARAGIDREAVGRVPSISRQLMVAITGTLGGF